MSVEKGDHECRELRMTMSAKKGDLSAEKGDNEWKEGWP